jgi:hypothetical protein
VVELGMNYMIEKVYFVVDWVVVDNMVVDLVVAWVVVDSVVVALVVDRVVA